MPCRTAIFSVEGKMIDGTGLLSSANVRSACISVQAGGTSLINICLADTNSCLRLIASNIEDQIFLGRIGEEFLRDRSVQLLGGEGKCEVEAALPTPATGAGVHGRPINLPMPPANLIDVAQAAQAKREFM
jgi:hypothetical protein